MRIVVTGSSGFLGSWICRVLALGHEVTALVRPTSDIYRLGGIKALSVTSLDSSQWADFIATQKPDVLILADWWGVGNHDRNDARQTENIARIENLVRAARNAGVGSVIGVGSQAELGPVSNLITEDLPDKPTTTYGAAKVQARSKAEEILEGSKTRFVWMRIFSTYGALDSDTWLIPQLIDTLAAGSAMDLTKGEQEWSYLHAFDLARAFQSVVEQGSISGIVNVGNPQRVVLKDAILGIAEQLGVQGLLNFGALPYRSDQVMKLEPACESLTAIGWGPIVSFENGIKQTIQWRLRMALAPLRCEDGQEVVFKLPSRR